MDADSTLLEKHLKKATIISNLISMAAAVIGACLIAYAFYYDTTVTLDQNTHDIQEVRSQVNEIKTTLQDNAVFQGVSKTEIEAIKKQMTGVEAKVDRIDEKLDRILFQTRD